MAVCAASSNLGQLERLAAPDEASASAAAYWAATERPASFSGGGVINIDGGAVFASLLVLVLLLALSTNRILGLERFLG